MKTDIISFKGLNFSYKSGSQAKKSLFICNNYKPKDDHRLFIIYPNLGIISFHSQLGGGDITLGRLV